MCTLCKKKKEDELEKCIPTLTWRSASTFLSGLTLGEVCVPVALHKAHKEGQEALHSTEVKGSFTTGALASRSPFD